MSQSGAHQRISLNIKLKEKASMWRILFSIYSQYFNQKLLFYLLLFPAGIRLYQFWPSTKETMSSSFVVIRLKPRQIVRKSSANILLIHLICFCRPLNLCLAVRSYRRGLSATSSCKKQNILLPQLHMETCKNKNTFSLSQGMKVKKNWDFQRGVKQVGVALSSDWFFLTYIFWDRIFSLGRYRLDFPQNSHSCFLCCTLVFPTGEPQWSGSLFFAAGNEREDPDWFKPVSGSRALPATRCCAHIFNHAHLFLAL